MNLLRKFKVDQDFSRRTLLDIFFILVFTALSLHHNYQEYMFFRPQGVHVWRQTDNASMALNYHQKDLPLLHPQMHYRFGNNGEAVGEFPLLYFIVGKLYDVFGFHEAIFRFFWYLIAFAGSFSLYRLSLGLTRSGPSSILIGNMLICSPVMAYYSISFLSDPVAIYFVAIASYFCFLAWKGKSKGYFITALIFSALAGLTKISALIVPFALFITYTLHALEGRKFREALLAFAGFILVFAVNYGWYLFAMSFNAENSTGYFLTSVVPIWQMPSEEIRELVRIILEDRIYYLYNGDVIILAFIFFLSSLLIKKHIWSRLLFILICIVFSTLYVLMFFPRFLYHDYYMISVLPLFPALYILSFASLNEIIIHRSFSILSTAILLVMMVRSEFISSQFVRTRFDEPFHDHYIRKDYSGLGDFLKEINVKEDDLVISIPDESPNISLYLMNRCGWSNLYYEPMRSSDIEYLKSHGAKYLLVGDSALLVDEEIRPFTSNFLGRHGEVNVYSLD